MRTATYENEHLAVVFVPSGCVDSYNFYQEHKGDLVPKQSPKRNLASRRNSSPKQPVCVPVTPNASTIVGYQDNVSGSAVDALAAQQRLTSIHTESEVAPNVVTSHSLRSNSLINEASASGNLQATFDQDTFKSELLRLNEDEQSRKRDSRYGFEALSGAVLLLGVAIPFHRRNSRKRTTQLVYTLTDAADQNQGILDQSVDQLSRSNAVWRLINKSTSSDWKRNAGAAYLVKRERIRVESSVPPRVESNVIPRCINLGGIRLYFFPDLILYWQSGTFASITYEDIAFESTSTHFIEDEPIPSDSRQIGSTWRYVRKDGGPDRRFNNNRQLPVLLYGVIIVTSSKGLNVVLNTSNSEAATTFVGSFHNFQSHRSERLSVGDSRKPLQDPLAVQQALKVLGLESLTSPEKIAEAYRHLAQMYHPDKVAGLGPELRTLAEERMKEINAAYQLLKHHQEVFSAV